MKKISFLFIMLLLLPPTLSAEVPKLINYSGKLTDKPGNLLKDGTYDMKFSLWEAQSGGTVAAWTEDHYIIYGRGVEVKNGAFNIILGGYEPLPAFDKNYWLELMVIINSQNETFTRQQLISVPYSLQSENTNGVSDGIITNSKLASNAVSTEKIVDNAVTQVKLADNSISTSKLQDNAVTLTELANDSVNSSKIINGAIQTSDLGNDVVTYAKIAAGADLPIGTILAWHKNFTNTPSLPPQYVECNGQRITDTESPYYNLYVPNLNGDTRFLRGGSTSGALQDDAFQGHWHQWGPDNNRYTYFKVGYGIDCDVARIGGIKTGDSPDEFRFVNDPTTDEENGTPRIADETRPKNMSVLWIIKIK